MYLTLDARYGNRSIGNFKLEKSTVMRPFSPLVIVGSCFLLGLVGCGDSGPKTYHVKGKVAYKDQPVEGAGVTFHPTGPGNLAVGQTNAQGEFELLTFAPGDGAVAGDYVVTVIKTEGSVGAKVVDPMKKMDGAAANQASEEMSRKMKEGGGAKKMLTQMMATKQLLPAKYAKQETSTLKATVKTDPSANNFTFTLED